MEKVLVTGGNKGIGLEVTKMLKDLGYEVIVLARDFSNFDIENVKKVEFDLNDVKGIPNILKKIGDIDILINNAGFMQPHIPYDNYPKKDIEHIMNVNLYAPIELITLCSESMKRKKRGRIVNNASIAGQIGHPDVWYGMGKAALINATKIYAKLLGKDGIVVNCVAPSPVETDMQAVNSEQRKAEFKKSVITNRFADAKEVAKTIVWLAIDSPEYINGICIDINNGSYMR